MFKAVRLLNICVKCEMTSTYYLIEINILNNVYFVLFRIKEIPVPAFQDLHSLQWIKLYNNDLRNRFNYFK
jgi:hypothetical protein